MSNVTPPDDGYIYIDEVCKIIDRVPATIRQWERDALLPKRLMPRRGWRNWRCWTHGQVYGTRGLIAWMKSHDMRPGNVVTDPKLEHQHVHNLRKPKYLSEEQIEMARQWAQNRHWYIEQIVDELLPHTKYQSAAGLTRVLVKLFKQRGWKVPPSAVAEKQARERERLKRKNLSQTAQARTSRRYRAKKKAEAEARAAAAA